MADIVKMPLKLGFHFHHVVPVNLAFVVTREKDEVRKSEVAISLLIIANLILIRNLRSVLSVLQKSKTKFGVR